MKIKIIGVTESKLENVDGRSDTPYQFCAKTMGACVSSNPLELMATENLDTTLKRLDRTLKERHHSGFDMYNIVLEMDDVSKIFCMFLNNLHTFTTEETSGRHKELVLPPKEKAVFDYFYGKFYNYACEKSPDAPERVKKQIALENARYTTGLNAKTNIVHTVTLRHLNYVYNMAKNLLNKENLNIYEQLVLPDMQNFCDILDEMTIENEPIINPILQKDPYGREFNLFGDRKKHAEHFGKTYEIYYQASATATAQLQRHRPIYMEISIPEKTTYYVPPIVKELDLQDDWVEKIAQLNNVPQARLLDVCETGQLANYIMKMKERCCEYAQEEAKFITKEQANKIFKGLEQYDRELAAQMQLAYGNGKNRRDFPDYKCVCSHPCKPVKLEQERQI